MSQTLIKKKEVCSRTSLSYSSIQRLMKAGTFPKSIKLPLYNTIAWVEADVDAWIDAAIAAGVSA